MLRKVIWHKEETESLFQCKECGINTHNGNLCRKCGDKKYPITEDHYHINYYKGNVHQYSKKYNVPLQVAAVEINRLVSDFWDDFALEFVAKEKKILSAKWFLFGYVLGSAVVASLLAIF